MTFKPAEYCAVVYEEGLINDQPDNLQIAHAQKHIGNHSSHHAKISGAISDCTILGCFRPELRIKNRTHHRPAQISQIKKKYRQINYSIEVRENTVFSTPGLKSICVYIKIVFCLARNENAYYSSYWTE